MKKDFHICLDGTIINYFITDLDLQRKEITLEDKIQPNDFKKYEMELFRILDTEYKVVN